MYPYIPIVKHFPEFCKGFPKIFRAMFEIFSGIHPFRAEGESKYRAYSSISCFGQRVMTSGPLSLNSAISSMRQPYLPAI